MTRPKDDYLSPRDFLKTRRPERFSDSFVEESPSLDRAMLEYHLETLTNRSQEADFQRFALHLIQREICPNVLPQTGPTGGGDSKVDSETYPVARDLAITWHIGIGTAAASERWAFAFSTKKVWRSKVASDIAKIAATGRGYSKAMFVTNQFVSDRKRAGVEDSLREKHGIDVRILDRTWILDRVFEAHHEALAIEDLQLQGDVRSRVRIGPADYQKSARLAELEGRIAHASHEGKLGHALVDDCIETVQIARSLERPRTEIDGLIARAERVAAEHGSQHQRLVAAYQHASTAFWWLEDFAEFNRIYSTVEENAKSSDNIYHLELLHNLWYLLTIIVRDGEFPASELDLGQRTSTLRAALRRIKTDESRPTAALEAQSMTLMMDLLQSATADPSRVLTEIKSVVNQCANLIGFALEPLVEILTEIGNLFGNSPAYEELFSTVEDIWANRQGELSAARLLLSRGAQQLDADRPAEAIRTLGRALMRLFKNESTDELIRALYLCAAAYERIGLLWASRGTILNAASLAAGDFWTYEEVTPVQAACYNRMKWLEVQLGRIPHALAWHELDRIVNAVLAEKGEAADQQGDGEIEFDGILGMLLLRGSLADLKHLSKLPQSLEELNLFYASLALRFALGDETSVAEDLNWDVQKKGELTDFFLLWKQQPAARDIPCSPQLGDSQKLLFHSVVAGCRVELRCDNEPACVSVAESILAALEGLLATGIVDRMVPLEPSLAITVAPSQFAEPLLTYDLVDTDGRPSATIRCSKFNPHRMPKDDQVRLKDSLSELLIVLAARVFLVDDVEAFIRSLFESSAVERAVNFASSFVVMGNVLGDKPKTQIDDWCKSGGKEFPVTRREEWDTGQNNRDALAEPKTEPLRMGQGPPPDDLVRPERARHDEMESVSLIRVPLWNKAGWAGMGFIVLPDKLPILLPVFRNEDAARKIFANLRSELGRRDDADRLRVSIIRGIRKAAPFSYRIVFGSNLPRNMGSRDTRCLVMSSRIHTMEPETDDNLRGFLQQYENVRGFVLVPGIIRTGTDYPEALLELAIEKENLHVRDAWQIRENDLDRVGILPDDDPVIPNSVGDAPVTALLAAKTADN